MIRFGSVECALLGSLVRQKKGSCDFSQCPNDIDIELCAFKNTFNTLQPTITETKHKKKNEKKNYKRNATATAMTKGTATTTTNHAFDHILLHRAISTYFYAHIASQLLYIHIIFDWFFHACNNHTITITITNYFLSTCTHSFISPSLWETLNTKYIQTHISTCINASAMHMKRTRMR